MKSRITICTVIICSLVVLAFGQNLKIGEGRLSPRLLNYQGYLTDTLGNPTNDSFDFLFRIYDASSAGNMLWSENQIEVPVLKGIFHVSLGIVSSIPDSVFTKGTNRWLELRFNSQTLSPRTRIVSAPYAYTATHSDTADYARNVTPDNKWIRSGGKVYPYNLTDTVGIRTTLPRYALDVNGVICGGTADTVKAVYGAVLGGYSNLAGDAAADTSAAVCAGYNNSALEKYSFIGGGRQNQADGNFASIGGGYYNSANGEYSLIAGGIDNQTDTAYSVVCGGFDNLAHGMGAFIGGGYFNRADSSYSVTAGGTNNVAGGRFSFVGSGYGDSALGTISVIGGGQYNKALYGAAVGGGEYNQANGSFSAIAGGNSNLAAASYSTIAGGSHNTVNNIYAAVAGGYDNTISGNYAVISGGRADTVNCLYGGILSGYSNLAGDAPEDTAAVVCGGWDNAATGKYSFVGGGQYDTASGIWSTVGGGSRHSAVGDYCGVFSGYNNHAGNDVTDTAAVVCGGYNAMATAPFSFVGGGQNVSATYPYAIVVGGTNNISASNYGFIGGGNNNTIGGTTYSTICGGLSNTTSSGGYNFIGGGTGNNASYSYSTVCGGYYCSATQGNAAVCGGDNNAASGNGSFIGSGYHNCSSGQYSSIPGGFRDTTAGYCGFAANNHAKVMVTDTNSAAFTTSHTIADNQVRAASFSTGTLCFSLDHPKDPMNKILNQYAVGSDEAMLMYTGTAVIDANGHAAVSLPDYFSDISQNPRIQLTGVGGPDIVYVAKDITGNSFVIGGKSGMKVYWTVTAERKDVQARIAYAKTPVVQEKTGDLRGHSLDDDALIGIYDGLQKDHPGEFSFKTEEGRQANEQIKKLPHISEQDNK